MNHSHSRHSTALASLVTVLCLAVPGRGEPPVASYLFPAGGQRGTQVDVRVGGLYLGPTCGFDLFGAGVTGPPRLRRGPTLWFEGPLLPLPESQQAEDYPKDMYGSLTIAADAAPGTRPWRVWTSQGATPALRFVVGDEPEVVEAEIDGDPIPVEVRLPVTVNGRVFPREDVDDWAISVKKGQMVYAEVNAARLGSPLDARLEVFDPKGRLLTANDDALGADAALRFTANEEGVHRVRIHDVTQRGGQAFVYRLTLTSGPRVDRTYPLGGRRGAAVSLTLTGQAVPATATVTVPADAPADHGVRLDAAGGPTNRFLLDVDDLPEFLEQEPNDEPAAARSTEWPAVCNGRVDRPADTDGWAFATKKGQVLEIELRAARLGSPLQGVLTVTDVSGKVLATADAGAALDPALRFTAPTDGSYVVRVADRFRSRAGPAFAYRLRVAAPPAPDFRLELSADAVTVPRGGQAKLRVEAKRRGGFSGPITLEVAGLPPGITATGTALAANAGSVELVFKADKDAPVRAERLTVRGSATVGGATVTRVAAFPGPRGEVEVDRPLLAVAVPTPFVVSGEHDMRWAPRGTYHKRRYRVDRKGFDGPLEVSLADRQARHLQGVVGPTVTVPAGATEFEYGVQLPPWMETGRTCRVTVMAVGVVKDPDGSEHRVSFSSARPDEQIIAVIEPGRLGLETERTSVAARPGGTATVAVRVTRGKGLVGPATVELLAAGHLRGLSAEPLELPAGTERGVLTLRFGPDARGPFNVPVVLRATVRDTSGPVTAETRLEVLSTR